MARPPTNTHVFDCIVVGAGPNGLALAAELRYQGVTNFIVLDRLATPNIQTKATIVWPGCLDQLAKYSGVMDTIHSRCEFVHQIAYSTKDGYFSKVPLGKYFASRYKHGVFVEQWHTEKALTMHLVEHNVEIRRQTELESYEYIAPDVIQATLVVNRGQVDEMTHVVCTKYLVGCDGGRSVVRKLMGVPFDGETLPHSMMNAHIRTKEPLPVQRDELRQICFEAGSSFITPLPDNSYFVAIDVSQQQDKYCSPTEKTKHGDRVQLDFTMEQLEDICSERIMPMQIESVVWQSHFRVPHRLARSFVDTSSHVFIAGDAAHCHTPLMGLGLTIGVQEAVNLGWKLAFVLSGRAQPSLLATYASERREAAAATLQVLKKTSTAFHVYGPLKLLLRRSSLWYNSQTVAFQKGMSASMDGSYIHYATSPLSVNHIIAPTPSSWSGLQGCQELLGLHGHALPKVQAGDLAPHLARADPVFYRGTGFKLLLFTGIGHGQFTHAQLQTIGDNLMHETCGVVSSAMVVTAVEDHQAFDVQAPAVFLVRPDGFVGLRTNVVDDASIVMTYLATRVGIRGIKASDMTLDATPTRTGSKSWSLLWAAPVVMGMVTVGAAILKLTVPAMSRVHA
ncbi:hypothetical protein DYB32_001155 [Aphanomyces invadans]|uniref:FAD-binding domain-containing protein n=1 Tax=Aphanomyces invadans TaxID=157072 RepID=A0A418B7C6_9STRA|nr:hypothetical protein DYB32_001155 [Aphanomyces invadans]